MIFKSNVVVFSGLSLETALFLADDTAMRNIVSLLMPPKGPKTLVHMVTLLELEVLLMHPITALTV